MGHYASEMISDEEREEAARQRRMRRNRIARNIAEAVRKEGIEFVLADILDEPTIARIRFDRV